MNDETLDFLRAHARLLLRRALTDTNERGIHSGAIGIEAMTLLEAIVPDLGDPSLGTLLESVRQVRKFLDEK